MAPVKTFLAGLSGVSLCMANKKTGYLNYLKDEDGGAGKRQ